jgi:hypothetical protein
MTTLPWKVISEREELGCVLRALLMAHSETGSWYRKETTTPWEDLPEHERETYQRIAESMRDYVR